MKKRLIWIAILALVLVFFASTTAVSAATVAEGTCGAEGSNLAWVLDDEGTLTISGKGKMADFESPGSNDAAPWMKYQLDILRIDVADGVNGIGDYAFCCCTNVTRAALPKKKNANHSGGASI